VISIRATLGKGFKETLSLLEDLKKQQKFAQAITAQHAAREVKKWAVKKLFPHKKPGQSGFKRRGNWASKGPFSFQVTPRKVNRNIPTATIQSGAPWIQQHEVGGTRKPKYIKELGGVPVALTGKGKPRKSTYAKIPKSMGPLNMLRRGRAKGAFKRLNSQGFIKTTRSGGRALFVRTKGGGLSAQYHLPKRVKIPAKLGFVKRGTPIAKRAYIRLYAGNLIKALKSSNRRKVKTK
jgi:hypothetical protein